MSNTKNKYVSFVSDDDFLECIKKVISAYPENIEKVSPIQLFEESNNTIDEFKTIFDVLVPSIGFDKWSKSELTRQYDKTINNKIGEFHQELLGKVEGWVDLGVGHELEIDLKNEDNTIFIELKNKYNTMNSSSTKTCREKLENAIKKYPNATAYWGYIISKNYKIENRIWVYQNKEDERIRKIDGKSLYELVTGESDALEQTFNAIPLAIKDIKSENYYFSDEDQKIFNEINTHIFKD